MQRVRSIKIKFLFSWKPVLYLILKYVRPKCLEKAQNSFPVKEKEFFSWWKVSKSIVRLFLAYAGRLNLSEFEVENRPFWDPHPQKPIILFFLKIKGFWREQFRQLSYLTMLPVDKKWKKKDIFYLLLGNLNARYFLTLHNIWPQWFCYLCVLHPWGRKIPKDAK